MRTTQIQHIYFRACKTNGLILNFVFKPTRHHLPKTWVVITVFGQIERERERERRGLWRNFLSSQQDTATFVRSELLHSYFSVQHFAMCFHNFSSFFLLHALRVRSFNSASKKKENLFLVVLVLVEKKKQIWNPNWKSKIKIKRKETMKTKELIYVYICFFFFFCNHSLWVNK